MGHYRRKLLHTPASGPDYLLPEVIKMRVIGMILSLGAIMWVLYQSAGGGEAETVIPEGQQAALNKAKDLESSMQSALEKRMESEDEASY